MRGRRGASRPFPSTPVHAVVAALLVAATLFPTTALAQRDQPRQLSEAELARRIAKLRGAIRELEDTKKKIEDRTHVLLLGPGAAVLVEQERVESLFVTAVSEGRMTADQLVSAAQTIGKTTVIYVRDIVGPDLERLRRDLADLDAEVTRRQSPQEPRAPGFVGEWPEPMDWRKVRGVVGGTFIVQCAYEGQPLPPTQGTVRLVFTGDGTLRGEIVDADGSYAVNGTIDGNGNANGGGAGGLESQYSWTASFARSGDVIVMTSHTLSLAPEIRGATCRPGYVRQQ